MMSDHSQCWSQEIHRDPFELAIDASTCPMCQFSVVPDPTSASDQDVDEKFYLEGSADWGKKRVHWEDEPRKRSKLQRKTTWSMGLHIAEHLHHLMVITLQIISSMDAESYGESGAGSAIDRTNKPVTNEGGGQRSGLGRLELDSQPSVSFVPAEDLSLATNLTLNQAHVDANQEGGNWDFLRRDEMMGEVDREVVRAFTRGRDLEGGETLSWETREVPVRYHSPPDPPIQIGDVHVRLVMAEVSSTGA